VVPPPVPAPAPAPALTPEQEEAILGPLAQEAAQADQEALNRLFEETTTQYTYENWVPYDRVRANWERLANEIRERYDDLNIPAVARTAFPESAQRVFVPSQDSRLFTLMDIDTYVSHITPITPVTDPEPIDTMGYMAAYRTWRTRLGDRQLTQAEYDNLGADWVKGLFKKNKKGNYKLRLGTEIDKISRDATRRAQKTSRWKTLRSGVGKALGIGPAFPKPTAAAPAPTAAAAPKPGFSFPTKPWKIGVAPAPAPAAAADAGLGLPRRSHAEFVVDARPNARHAGQ
jgi:hypothetical protein